MTSELPRVLVVDDTEANLIALEALLSKLPCQVVTCRSGNDALRLLLKHPFAVVLLDVQMAEMDGYEVATIARGHPATCEVPIVFVTAMAPTEENALRGYGAGAVDFLFKPVNPTILTSKVKVFLELWSSRQRLQEEVEAHKETLAELQAFNYSVSHDLRAPLRPLDGFSQILLEDYGDKLDDEGKNYLQRIRAGAQRMGQLIDAMLLLSRMTRGEMWVKPVDLGRLAREVVDELRRNDAERQVDFSVTAAETEVRGDERLLRVALENLLRNAWKFSARVERPVVELGATTEPSGTVWFVRDNGAGFDNRYADRLFQPFQRLHAASEFEGTGIGLAIVHRIVRRHGGKIWARSSPGQGATFFFRLGTGDRDA